MREGGEREREGRERGQTANGPAGCHTFHPIRRFSRFIPHEFAINSLPLPHSPYHTAGYDFVGRRSETLSHARTRRPLCRQCHEHIKCGSPFSVMKANFLSGPPTDSSVVFAYSPHRLFPYCYLNGVPYTTHPHPPAFHFQSFDPPNLPPEA